MSKIEWTGKAWNVLSGCTPVSSGCLNCYAATLAGGRLRDKPRTRELTVLNNGRHVFNGTVRLHEDLLDEPLRRRTPTTWFVGSQSDLFHESAPFEFIDRVFAVMALCPQHTFQVLTKRPERMAEYLNDDRTRHRISGVMVHEFIRPNDPNRNFFKGRAMFGAMSRAEAMDHNGPLCGGVEIAMWPLPNVWLGTSVEDQAAHDERVPHLRRCPAAMRWLSVEPLLGRVKLDLEGIGWVVVGGESGARKKIRPSHLCDIFDVVAQCRVANVPVFVKQLGDVCMSGGEPLVGVGRRGGDFEQFPEPVRVRQLPAHAGMVRAEATG